MGRLRAAFSRHPLALRVHRAPVALRRA